MKSIDLLYSSIPSNYDLQQSSDRFPEIYSWINLFDTNIYLIITLMIIVGGINMITALLVTVLDKTKLIASLKVLGSNNNSIKKIFMINGFYLILRGVILGNLISLSLMFLQKYFMIIKLDPNTYYSDYVPIEIDHVDGFHPTNFGRMALNLPTFISATPYGIMELLKRYDVQTEGKHTVVIGRSDIVGKPISLLMGLKTNPGNSTVTMVHSRQSTYLKNVVSSPATFASLI